MVYVLPLLLCPYDIIYDILDNKTPIIDIYEDKHHNIILKDLHLIEIENYAQVCDVLKLSKHFRALRENASKSHCIYTIYIQYTNKGNNHIMKSKINIVDLASSSEKDSQYVNVSLNSLGNVFNAIALNKKHIPYRDCKLTHYLKESFIKSFNILLLLHISPNENDINETISTLEFGSKFCKLCNYNSPLYISKK